MIVVISGLTGTAKTTGARELGKDLYAPVLTTDEIRKVTPQKDKYTPKKKPWYIFWQVILEVNVIAEASIPAGALIVAGGFLGLESAPSSVPKINTSPGVVLRSEFGSYSDVLYTSFRIYF